MRPRLVLAAPLTPEAITNSVLHLANRNEHAHAAFDLESIPALVLVRSDGHLAFRGPADQPALLTKYCKKVFGLTPACELNVYD